MPNAQYVDSLIRIVNVVKNAVEVRLVAVYKLSNRWVFVRNGSTPGSDRQNLNRLVQTRDSELCWDRYSGVDGFVEFKIVTPGAAGEINAAYHTSSALRQRLLPQDRRGQRPRLRAPGG